MVVLWLGLLLSSVSKHNMLSYYGWLCRCCRLSISIICGGIMIGLSLSSVSKHNMWWYYGWVCHCRLSVSIQCGITIGFIVVFVRQQTEYVVIL